MYTGKASYLLSVVATGVTGVTGVTGATGAMRRETSRFENSSTCFLWLTNKTVDEIYFPPCIERVSVRQIGHRDSSHVLPSDPP